MATGGSSDYLAANVLCARSRLSQTIAAGTAHTARGCTCSFAPSCLTYPHGVAFAQQYSFYTEHLGLGVTTYKNAIFPLGNHRGARTRL
jgi:hypothetical protein